MADKLDGDERTPIKERLNLHVKKRLQQEQQQYTETAVNAGLDVGGGNAKKPRKPYQKRTDLVAHGVTGQPTKYQEVPTHPHTGATSSIDPSLGQQPAKKNRRPKTKKPDGDKAATVVSQHTATTQALTVLTGDEGPDGTPDMNLRSPQGRDKYPDVLGLVLNTKRNELMRDPAVQAFLKQIFDAIRQ